MTIKVVQWGSGSGGQSGSMGRTFDEITEPMQDFIARQQLFFRSDSAAG